MTETTSSWEKMIDALRSIGERTARAALHGHTEQSRHETYRMLATSFAQGVIERALGDPDYPTFAPHMNHALNLAAPVPDNIYMAARIRGEGCYRISGFRGTARIVLINIRQGQYADASGTGANLGVIDIDDLHRSSNGYFSVVLSEERPQDYHGDWVHLNLKASYLLARSICYDWNTEIDARFAIERLDVPASAPRPSPERIQNDLAVLPAWTERVVARWLENPVAEMRRKGVVNRLEKVDYEAIGGTVGQVYYEGGFDITADEALLIETDVPQIARYWSILLAGDQYASVDWVNRQSSLNGFQARLDEDGKFRAVIALSDPGVPNWLDTGGYGQGVIQLRWNKCSSSPRPTVLKIGAGEVRRYVPADTPVVTPSERDRQLRFRREGAQLRRRW